MLDVGQAVGPAHLQPGDLIFTHAGHVGIYVGGGQMIHAPTPGTVVSYGSASPFYAARRL
jgi:cell wall-associated NlpC family hydrolase